MLKSTASTTIPAHTTTPPRWVTLEVCAPVLGYVYSQFIETKKRTKDSRSRRTGRLEFCCNNELTDSANSMPFLAISKREELLLSEPI